MGKTADLTAVQKTIIDTFHKEGKPQTFIAKEAGCSQSAVSKHVNRKLSGRKKCGRKRCTTNQESRSLERLPLLNHRQCQRRLTWAKEKKKWTVAQWSKVLFSDESKFCISFGNQGPRVRRKGGEAHSPSCWKSIVKFTQWGVPFKCLYIRGMTSSLTSSFVHWSHHPCNQGPMLAAPGVGIKGVQHHEHISRSTWRAHAMPQGDIRQEVRIEEEEVQDLPSCQRQKNQQLVASCSSCSLYMCI
ncbi:Transposable element Tc1 transposase [Labeo rohita]|uniref:Transposable element Tc1 transposase n=1 Tax=Labeo rohita TaxID=84645 RepID=A0ABQ8L1Y0_LABRO|nr:Transposable element Tc1 transposase [Labeo rohita]